MQVRCNDHAGFAVIKSKRPPPPPISPQCKWIADKLDTYVTHKCLPSLLLLLPSRPYVSFFPMMLWLLLSQPFFAIWWTILSSHRLPYQVGLLVLSSHCFDTRAVYTQIYTLEYYYVADMQKGTKAFHYVCNFPSIYFFPQNHLLLFMKNRIHRIRNMHLFYSKAHFRVTHTRNQIHTYSLKTWGTEQKTKRRCCLLIERGIQYLKSLFVFACYLLHCHCLRLYSQFIALHPSCFFPKPCRSCSTSSMYALL